MLGKEDHVAALLDSGADAAMPTTHAVDDGHAAGGREAGTTAITLARMPARSDGSGNLITMHD